MIWENEKYKADLFEKLQNEAIKWFRSNVLGKK